MYFLRRMRSEQRQIRLDLCNPFFFSGQAESNLTSGVLNGITESPLTDLGRRQAGRAADWLTSRQPPFDLIYRLVHTVLDILLYGWIQNFSEMILLR